MDSVSLSDYFLTATVTYGAPALGLALMLGALGVPLPGTFFVLAAGAFVRQGAIDMYSTIILALLGVLSGDTLSYSMGRFAGNWVQSRFAHSTAWQNAQNKFEQRGGIMVYLTRCLLTPLAIPTNLIAGGSHYPFLRFFSYDVAGELTWLIVYGGLGYIFGTQWELISQVISDFSGLLVGVVALGAGVYFLVRRLRGKAVVGKAQVVEGV